MAIQPIPIKLQAATVPTGLVAANLQELLVLITRYTAAQITEDIGFFRFSNDLPTTNVGPFYSLYYNQWYQWSADLGRYINNVGTAVKLDVLYSYNDSDDYDTGWIVADGRLISSIPSNSPGPGLTTRQRAVLEGEWGAGGNLPNLRQANLVAFNGSVPAANGTYTLVLNNPWPAQLMNVTLKTNVGTVTAHIKTDGTTVTGLNAVAVTDTKDTNAPTDETLMDIDEDVTVVVTDNAAAAATLYFTVVLRPTAADSLVGRIYVGTP